MGKLAVDIRLRWGNCLMRGYMSHQWRLKIFVVEREIGEEYSNDGSEVSLVGMGK